MRVRSGEAVQKTDQPQHARHVAAAQPPRQRRAGLAAAGGGLQPAGEIVQQPDQPAHTGWLSAPATSASASEALRASDAATRASVRADEEGSSPRSI